MYLSDTHTHSYHSFDGAPNASVDTLCKAAIAAGLNELSITDHYECIYMLEDFYDMLDFDARERDILAAKEKYAHSLMVTYGLEIGQPSFAPEEAVKVINSRRFDFVIGSLHTAPGIRDIYYENLNNYTNKQLIFLWNQYLKELEKHIGFGSFDTVGHITYPWRYIVRSGRQEALNISDYKDSFEKLFKMAIDKGIAIECNTSGFRQGLDAPMPDFELLKLYHDMGGELLTIGSDAHKPEHIGADIKKTTKMLSEIGFKYITVYRERKACMMKIN